MYDDADVRRAVMAVRIISLLLLFYFFKKKRKIIFFCFVSQRAMPKTLVNLVGLDELLDNRVNIYIYYVLCVI